MGLIPHLFMNARIIASSALAVLSFGMSSVAFAEEAVSIDTLQQELKALSCADKEGKAVGICIGDALKRIKSIELAFGLQYKEDVKAWRAAHDGDGISKEYTLAQKEFNDAMQAKRKEFQESVRVIRKAFFDQLSVERVQKSEVNTKGSSPLNTAEVKELLKKCSEKFASDQDGERVCLRNIIQRQAAVEKRLAPVRARVKAEEAAAATRVTIPRR